MSSIDVARLELVWHSTSNIKPANVPHYSLFKRIKGVKITWFAESYGELTLKNENVNYMYYKGHYYFLRKHEPLDEDKKVFNYIVIKDFWMSMLLRKIKVTGNLIKTNDESVLWDNLQSTIPITNNFSGLTRLNSVKSNITVAEIMDDVEIINSDKIFKTKVITKNAYQNFLQSIIEIPGYQVLTSNYVGILSRLKLTEVDSWKQKVLNNVQNWLKENKNSLIIGGITNENLNSAAPNLSRRIRKIRGMKKSADVTAKSIRLETGVGILTSTKEDSYIKKIDLSGLTDIEMMSKTEDSVKKSRLIVELFDEEENFNPSKQCYLRPKLYSKFSETETTNKKIIDNLHLAPVIYKTTIYWNNISKHPIQYADYLEDWSDGKYLANAISTNIGEKRMGFMPGSFSINFKTKLIRGLYIKEPISDLSFVNGINFNSNDVLKEYMKHWFPIDVEKIIGLSTKFNNIGEDLTKRVEYNILSKDGDFKKDGVSAIKEVTQKHKDLTKIKKGLETEIKIPLNEELEIGTLAVNNASYGFYEFNTKTEGNRINTFNENPNPNEIDLNETIVFITEPGDIKTEKYHNVKNTVGYGLRYCCKKEYDIEPDDSITKFINGENVNKAIVSIFKRLLKKSASTDSTEIHNKINVFINKVTKEEQDYEERWITKIDEDLKDQSIYVWLEHIWYNEIDYYADATSWIYYIMRYFWYYRTKKCPWVHIKKLHEQWPKKDGKYILPIEHKLIKNVLFLKFDKFVLSIST